MPPSRQVYLRRRIGIGTLAVIVLAALIYLPLALLAPVPATAAVPSSYSAPTTPTQALSLPGYGDSAIAAVGYPGLLATGGGTSPMPIASITKIITALVVLDKAPLGPTDAGPKILFTAADAGYLKSYAARDGDVYPIRVGGTMSERDVLTVALVPSANNYARALADWAYGSEANFLAAARPWLISHGLTSTTLTDCTGLNPQNTSVPTDLIALGKLALANPVITQLVNTKAITLPVVGLIRNTNQLLGISGIDGIKTGTLNSAGASLLFSSRMVLGGREIRLIGVVLDGPNHPTIDAAIATLVAAARSGFHLVTLATKGQVFARYATPWGSRTTAVASRTVTLVVWGGTRIVSRISAATVTEGRRGVAIGTVSFAAGPQRATVTLTETSRLPGPDGFWRLSHPALLH